MKIQSIEIRNFKGLEHFKLETQDKNVLLLGENGSGKTSFVRALEAFLESSRGKGVFERNLFLDKDALGVIKVTLSDGESYSFNHDGSSTAYEVERILQASKSKRFLEYKQLLRTYFLEDRSIDLFALLVEDLFGELVIEKDDKNIDRVWSDLIELAKKKNDLEFIKEIILQEFKEEEMDKDSIDDRISTVMRSKEDEFDENLRLFNEKIKETIKLVLNNANIFLQKFDSKINFPEAEPRGIHAPSVPNRLSCATTS